MGFNFSKEETSTKKNEHYNKRKNDKDVQYLRTHGFFGKPMPESQIKHRLNAEYNTNRAGKPSPIRTIKYR